MKSRNILLTFRSRNEFVNFSESLRVARIKLMSFGSGAGGIKNGSEERDGKNLVWMRSILSLK